MSDNMKLAFEQYFIKLEKIYENILGTKPTVPYTEDLNKALLLGYPDENGDTQWIPKEQLAVFNWESVEIKLGFTICDELRKYYNTFFFEALSGSFGSIELHFYKIDGTEEIGRIVFRNYKDAQYLFPGTELFIIGNAVVNDDDGYFIYFDNTSGKLFCYEADTKAEVLLSYSIARTIGNMEAIL